MPILPRRRTVYTELILVKITASRLLCFGRIHRNRRLVEYLGWPEEVFRATLSGLNIRGEFLLGSVMGRFPIFSVKAEERSADKVSDELRTCWCCNHRFATK